MNKLKHLREKAVLLRKKGKTLTQICKMLNRSKTTVYYWIKDVEIENKTAFLRTKKVNVGKAQKKASLATRRKFQKIHKEYREKAIQLWDGGLNKDSEFKQFIMYYWCEGTKKGKHAVSICNSNLYLMKFAKKWFERININDKKFDCGIQMHGDQDEEKLVSFWEKEIGVKGIRIIRKSNSGKMIGRNWNSMLGVFTIRFSDAYVKTMIDTWIELYEDEVKNLI
jgi:hypothetical protein